MGYRTFHYYEFHYCKNTSVSHNNPFAGKRRGERRMHFIVVKFNYCIVKNTCVSHSNPFAAERIGRYNEIHNNERTPTNINIVNDFIVIRH